MKSEGEDQYSGEESAADFDFRHQIFNTIVLLGAKKEIADLVRKSLDYGVNDADVRALENYNYELTTDIKSRLANAIGIKVHTKSV